MGIQIKHRKNGPSKIDEKNYIDIKNLWYKFLNDERHH